MIIVWVNKRNWKSPGPIVNMVLHNAASFSDLGYASHLCIGEGDPSETEKDLEEFYGLSPKEYLKIHRVPRYRMGKSTYSTSIFLYAYRLIRALARKDAVSVFTRDSGFLFFLYYLRKRYKNIEGFYELHDMYADLSWVENKKGGHRREWLYEHLLLPKMSGVVCITRDQEKCYNAIFPSLPSVAFPLGTDPLPDTAPPEEKRKRRTLIYVGHIHDEKGVNLLLSSAERLARENVRMLFLGGNPQKAAKLKQYAVEKGFGTHVCFAPFLPPREMHQAISREGSIGVVMLQDTYYNRHLTCPVKALDYLSHGIPGIGSDLPSVHEVLEAAGTYIAPDDTDAFVQAVLDLLNDPKMYEQMVIRSQERAEQISWRMRARALVGFAERIHAQHDMEVLPAVEDVSKPPWN